MERGSRGVLLALVLLAAVAGPGCNEGDTITNNPPTLSATCSARPAQGDAPLEVAFALGLAGAQGAVAVRISYGDGASGTDPDATHTYTEGGLYTASFTVTTPTQTARCATTVDVSGSASGGGGEPGSNLPPIADFRTNPSAKNGKISGAAPFTVNFNMCLTADPDGDELYFNMDLDGDGKWNVRGRTGASCREPWDYAAGTWKPLICVTDITPEGLALHPKQCRTYTVVATP
jgi:hypothetical protein